MYFKNPGFLIFPALILVIGTFVSVTVFWGFGFIFIPIVALLIQMISSDVPKIPYEYPEVSFSKDTYGINFTMRKNGEVSKTESLWWHTIYQHLPPQYKSMGESKIEYRSSIWHVLGIMPTKDAEKIKSAFKKMSLVYHPDVGGDNNAFNTLVNARDKALEKC